jgi:hypothetical protein
VIEKQKELRPYLVAEHLRDIADQVEAGKWAFVVGYCFSIIHGDRCISQMTAGEWPAKELKEARDHA